MTRLLVSLKWPLMIVLAVSTAASLAIFYSWTQDNARLKEIAFSQTRNQETLPARIVALNSWVYGNGGFAKNRKSFLLQSLGPTPIQVLDDGGDCADKSRLLAALLAEIGVESTLVMLYPCETCRPVHTIVEARGADFSIALDPVYDLHIPDGAGGYLGVDEIARQQERVWSTLNELRRERGTRDKINSYNYDGEHFTNARTINWHRNLVTRAAGGLLSIVGLEPFRVSRPRWLEDPKLFLGLALLVVAVGSALMVAVAIPRLSSRPGR